jgi:hypothetical protein
MTRRRDVIANLDELHAAERFRFANRLAAWIEVADGSITGAGYSGRGALKSQLTSDGRYIRNRRVPLGHVGHQF